MPMWVQLRAQKHVDENGKLKLVHPGDWVRVGKQTALRWLADGEAWIPDKERIALMGDNCGILVSSTDGLQNQRAVSWLMERHAGVDVKTHTRAALPFAKTLILEPTVKLRMGLLPIGFSLLDKWQVAIPLASYTELAIHIGSEQERAYTKSVIQDLRVPYYDTRMMWVKRCAEGRALLDAWDEERALGDNPHLALLRAVYRVKPMICALPVTWVMERYNNRV